VVDRSEGDGEKWGHFAAFIYAILIEICWDFK
jgi:hypothetical protein